MQRPLSRRTFLLAGSTASALWLTGCGGGGSADGAPWNRTSSSTPDTGSGTCSLATTTDDISAPTDESQLVVNFSNASGFASNTNTAMTLDDDLTDQFMGCSNQLSSIESLGQEIFVSFTQPLTASETGTSAMVRVLRLHLSIPHDTSGTSIQSGYKFNVGDPSNPTNCAQVFSGEMIVTCTDPSHADFGKIWAYTITSGTATVLDGYSFVGLLPLRLTNVVATAAAAGTGNNAAGTSATVTMNGTLPVLFEALSSYLG